MENTRKLSQKEAALLNLLAEHQGYYECPKDESGNRTGKLVGYAAQYESPEGPKHYVGERYWNFPRGAERDPLVMTRFVHDIVNQLRSSSFRMGCGEIDCAFGCPMGGIIPAYEIARVYGFAYACPDKEILQVKTAESREKSRLILGRHAVEPSWRTALVEDVGNNFSTTDKAIKLVEDNGGRVVLIICMINRSPNGLTFLKYESRKIPIIQAVLIPTPEYRQDDPYVAADVAAGNVVWKPKDNWNELTTV